MILNYISKMLGYIICAAILYIPVRLFYLKRKKREISYPHEMLLAAFVLYLVGLLSQTIIPKWTMGIDSITGKFYFDIMLSNEIHSINLIPFKTIGQYFSGDISTVASGDISSVSKLNILANLFLFAPIGFFVPDLWKRQRSIVNILALGFFTTCCIECIQYFIGGSSDIDDVVLNTIGVVFGYMVFKMSGLRRWSIFKNKRY